MRQHKEKIHEIGRIRRAVSMKVSPEDGRINITREFTRKKTESKKGEDELNNLCLSCKEDLDG